MLVKVAEATSNTKFPINFSLIMRDKKILTQFLLDCTSLNLDNNCRVNINDSASIEIFKHSRKLIAAVHAERIRRLRKLTSSK